MKKHDARTEKKSSPGAGTQGVADESGRYGTRYAGNLGMDGAAGGDSMKAKEKRR